MKLPEYEDVYLCMGILACLLAFLGGHDLGIPPCTFILGNLIMRVKSKLAKAIRTEINHRYIGTSFSQYTFSILAQAMGYSLVDVAAVLSSLEDGGIICATGELEGISLHGKKAPKYTIEKPDRLLPTIHTRPVKKVRDASILSGLNMLDAAW